jgi:hypothetical protein
MVVPLRTKWRWSTWLALARMALQIALSFGHVHLESLGTGSVVARVAASKAPSSQQNPAPVPHPPRTIEHFGRFNFMFVSPQRAAFQSRAPPLA